MEQINRYEQYNIDNNYINITIGTEIIEIFGLLLKMYELSLK